MSTPSSVASTDFYRAARADMLARPVRGAGASRRSALTRLTDEWLTAVFEASGADGAALLAVGGYGRGELAPGSDLDLLLLVPETMNGRIDEVADRIWYPAWDSGVRIDHSVRTVAQARRMAAQDVRVVLGLLDMRVVAGDTDLAERLRSSILADWRAMAAQRVEEMHMAALERRERSGELAHLLEPDLKESYGGLRDATVLRAIAASWLTDTDHHDVANAYDDLLDIRDALHDEALASGRRPGDTLLLQEQPAVAARLELADDDALLRQVSTAARAIAFACDGTWHRVTRAARRRPAVPIVRRLRRSGPQRVPLAEGVVAHDGEVVLAAEARPDRDPVLPLRLAAAAAQAGLLAAPTTVDRLAREAAPMPEPWPREARESLVSLLGAGEGLVPIWEALDQAGLVSRWIPEWTAVRSAPQHNPVHIYRVDRHLVEAAVQASQYVRQVDRPDLLLVGSLLHDIGKAQGGDHTEIGEALVARIAPRMGFDADDTDVLVALVRHHLLLPQVATGRDLDDPATIADVAAAVGNRRFLDLLHALTRADAQATGPAAWSDWKRDLIADLVERVAASLDGEIAPAAPSLAGTYADLLDAEGTQVRLLVEHPVSTVVVAADDRPGLLATIAGVLSLHRLEVKAADTQTVGDRAVTEWAVIPLFGEPPALDLLRSDVRRALAGELDVAARISARTRPPAQARARVPARVDFVRSASQSADVLEVRAHDEPGLLHRISTALAQAGAFVTAARVSTLGSEAVDVFYVRRTDGERLTPPDRAMIVAAVLEALAEDRPDAL